MGAFLSSNFVSTLFEGLTNGILYSLVALSLVLIWRSTHVLNFAQGAMAMFATYVGMTQIAHGVPFIWCVVISVAVGFVMGGITERVLIRPLYGKPEINPIVVMVGFLGLLESLATAIWSNTARTVDSPFSQQYFKALSCHSKANFADIQVRHNPCPSTQPFLEAHSILLNPYLIFQVLLASGIMVAIALVFKYTKLGLQLRAAATAPEVARLLGVRVSRMLTLGWMLASGVGAITAVVVAAASQGSLVPTIMDGFFVSGFIAAALGGLESPGGAVVGGLTLGVVTQIVLNYWSSNASQLVPLVVLIFVLMVRPQGLFTRHAERRV